MMGVPLSYMVRTELHPPDGVYDPPVRDPDKEYRSYDEEMVARAPTMFTMFISVVSSSEMSSSVVRPAN